MILVTIFGCCFVCRVFTVYSHFMNIKKLEGNEDGEKEWVIEGWGSEGPVWLDGVVE